jgi:hypothetical protein
MKLLWSDGFIIVTPVFNPGDQTDVDIHAIALYGVGDQNQL